MDRRSGRGKKAASGSRSQQIPRDELLESEKETCAGETAMDIDNFAKSPKKPLSKVTSGKEPTDHSRDREERAPRPITSAKAAIPQGNVFLTFTCINNRDNIISHNHVFTVLCTACSRIYVQQVKKSYLNLSFIFTSMPTIFTYFNFLNA